MNANKKKGQFSPVPVGSIDRPKPSNIEAEIAVLGSMLLDSEAFDVGINALRFEGAFYRADHQLIFDAMVELNAMASEAAVDPVILADHMEHTGHLNEAGGRGYITQIMDSVPTSANIVHYVEIVRQNAILRRIISTCSDAVSKCYDFNDDVKSLLDDIEKNVFEITGFNQAKDFVPIASLAYNAMDYLEQLINGNPGVLGLRTGFDFDRMITGLKPGELFVLAARPSIGKTALAVNIATNIALANPPASVGFFSLEMPALQLVLRMVCGITRTSLNDFRSMNVSPSQWADVQNAMVMLQNAQIVIDDTGAIDILELRAKARRMKSKHNVQVIFIDYLQLIKVQSKRNSNRENDVAMISGALKAMAKELNISVVVLAQLNRQAEQGEKPKLSHLRESGAIEQDADVVALLHRERNKQYEQGEDEDKPLPAEVIIAKNRNGATGSQSLLFFPKITRFENGSVSEEGEEGNLAGV